MKFRWDKKFLHWGITVFITVAALLCFYYILFFGENFRLSFHTFVQIFSPILSGLALVYMLTPIVNGIENNILIPIGKKRTNSPLTKEKEKTIKKRRRVISIIITVFFILLIIYGLIKMIIPQLLISIQGILSQFDTYVFNLTNWVENIFSKNANLEDFIGGILTKYGDELQNFLNTSIIPQIDNVIKSLSLSLLAFLKALWNLIIGLILAIYLMASKELFAGQSKKAIYAILERDTANHFIDNVRFVNRTFSKFIGGKILDSIIIGLLCFIGTTLLGIPYAILISVIIGVTNIIPFFGPYLGAIPSAILILMVSPIHCLYFIIFIFILQQIDGNVIGPKILGDSTGLTGFWVIFSITIFGGLFGVFGMIIGVPTFAVIYAAFKGLFKKLLVKKNLPKDTEHYLNVKHVTSDLEFIPTVVEKNSSMNRTFTYQLITKIRIAGENRKIKKMEKNVAKENSAPKNKNRKKK